MEAIFCESSFTKKKPQVNRWKIKNINVHLQLALSDKTSDVLICKNCFYSMRGYQFLIGIALNGIAFHESWNKNVSLFIQMCNDESNTQLMWPQQLDIYIVVLDERGNILYKSDNFPMVFDVPGSTVWIFNFVEKVKIFCGENNELEFQIFEVKPPYIATEVNSCRLIGLEKVLEFALQEIPLPLDHKATKFLPEASLTQTVYSNVNVPSSVGSVSHFESKDTKDTARGRTSGLHKQRIRSVKYHFFECANCHKRWWSDTQYFTDEEGYLFRLEVALNGITREYSWNERLCLRLIVIEFGANLHLPWPIKRSISVTLKDQSGNGSDIKCAGEFEFTGCKSAAWMRDFVPIEEVFGADFDFQSDYLQNDTIEFEIDFHSESKNGRNTKTDALSYCERLPKALGYQKMRIKKIPRIEYFFKKSVSGGMQVWTRPDFLVDEEGYVFNMEVALNGIPNEPSWGKSLCVRLVMIKTAKNENLPWPIKRHYTVTLKDQTNSGRDVTRTGSLTFMGPKCDVWIKDFLSISAVFGDRLDCTSCYITKDILEFQITFSSSVETTKKKEFTAS